MKVGTVARMSMLLALVLAGCGRTPSLETRTFRLQSLDDNTALSIIDPYVYADRPDAPGLATAMRGILTVRETEDNLDKIARVLEEFDSPRKSVTLHFQVILADGGGTQDSAIADVESELRKLFRFQGYQLIAQSSITGLEGGGVQQQMYDQRWTGSAESRTRIRYILYDVNAGIGSVSGVGDSAVVQLDVNLRAESSSLFGASVVVGIGNTVVLGTLQLPGNEALILTVRAELAG